MKSFAEFLTESKKTYPFKIGIAGELPKGFAEHMKMGLQKYDVSNISAGKKTPIQERPLDFPNIQNTEVTYFEVELNYPTTASVLHEYLSTLCTVPRSHILVRSPNDPLELQQAEKTEETYEAKLTKEDMGGESAQDKVGENRVMDLLKELEAARKDREHDAIKDTPKGEGA